MHSQQATYLAVDRKGLRRLRESAWRLSKGY
jgi:hypothetical protein